MMKNKKWQRDVPMHIAGKNYQYDLEMNNDLELIAWIVNK